MAQEKLSDMALVQKVEARLMDILGPDIRNVEVEAKKGSVLLKGTVNSSGIRENCEKTVSAIRDVKNVETQLTVVQYYRYGH